MGKTLFGRLTLKHINLMVQCQHVGFRWRSKKGATVAVDLSQGLPGVEYPFHDKDILVTACGRICMQRKKSTYRPSWPDNGSA